MPKIPGGKEEFYKSCKPHHGTAKVPVLKEHLKEEIIFDRIPVTLPCCVYEVCVVTQCYTVNTKQCVLAEQQVNLKVCFRNSGLVDVYVIGQPGMPKEWVLHLGITKAAYDSLYPGGPQP